MENDGNTYKIGITFIIDVPDTLIKSDFNTIILRLNELRKHIENNDIKDEICMKWNNSNITEIQKLLENFKYKEL